MTALPMIEPTPLPSKLRLLVTHTDEGFLSLHNCCLITYIVYLHVKNILLRYLSEIVYLSRYIVVILDCHSSDEKLSYRLNAINLLYCMVVSLVIGIGRSNWPYNEQSPSVCHQVNQSTGLMANVHLQYIVR